MGMANHSCNKDEKYDIMFQDKLHGGVVMLTVSNIGLRYGDKKLFEEVNLKFTPGNCYGVIGANGAGKSTFLKILSGEIEPNTGHVSYPKDVRMSVLKQDHYQYDELPVLENIQTVMEGVAKCLEDLKIEPDGNDKGKSKKMTK